MPVQSVHTFVALPDVSVTSAIATCMEGFALLLYMALPLQITACIVLSTETNHVSKCVSALICTSGLVHMVVAMDSTVPAPAELPCSSTICCTSGGNTMGWS